MNITKRSKLYIGIGITSIVAACASIALFGLNPSVDFQGGVIYEVSYGEQSPELDQIDSALDQDIPGAIVQSTDSGSIIIKMPTSDEYLKPIADQALSQFGAYEELRYKELGASVSQELANKSLFAILFVSLVLVGFIAYTFRGVSYPVASWKYGIVAIVALIHDTIIPVGVFAFLGSIFVNFQIDVLFVTAILATLGYSVNDTIVIFDRIRENLRLYKEQANAGDVKEEFQAIVERSLRGSFRRSIFTSLTTLAALLALFVLGGDVTKPFALVLAVGVFAGTYSSLFLASPLLVILARYSHDQDTSESSDDEDDTIPDDVKRFLARQNK